MERMERSDLEEERNKTLVAINDLTDHLVARDDKARRELLAEVYEIHRLTDKKIKRREKLENEIATMLANGMPASVDPTAHEWLADRLITRLRPLLWELADGTWVPEERP